MLIFAHRGASAHAPENTLSAFDLALEQKADGIELDVYQHGNDFCVIHDKWLSRTTNGKGNIYQHSWQQLRAFDAGNNQLIPSLKEAMAVISGKCLLNIEVKALDNTAQLIQYTDACCRAYDFSQAQIVFSSFDHHIISQVKAIAPHYKIGALTASKPINYAAFAQQLNAYSVNIEVSAVSAEFVIDAHARGLKVFSYTVHHKSDLLQLRDWGVDGVFVNSPVQAKQILAEN